MDRLSPSLTLRDFFAPNNWKHLNQDGIGYLLDGSHLGGIGVQLFGEALNGGCYAIGATAYRPPLV